MIDILYILSSNIEIWYISHCLKGDVKRNNVLARQSGMLPHV